MAQPRALRGRWEGREGRKSAGSQCSQCCPDTHGPSLPERRCPHLSLWTHSRRADGAGEPGRPLPSLLDTSLSLQLA